MTSAPDREQEPERRGAGVVDPRNLPWRAWLQILRRVLRRLGDDRFSLHSAAVAFFAVLSVAPVLLTALSVYGAVNTPTQAMTHLSGVVDVLPPAVGDVLADQLVSITAASTQVLTVRGLLAVAVALGTATTATTFLMEALTVAYREEETRGRLRRTGVALALVLGGAVAVGAVISASTVLFRTLSGVPDVVRSVVVAAVWVGLALLMVLTLAVLYRFAPDRRGRARWRWVSVGSVSATLAWLLTSAALFGYVTNFSSYERTYGSLAGVAISMLWLWLTVLLVVLGAALNAESERQTARDTTVGAERRPGRRGAVVADDVPPHPEDQG
ncbi:YihY/virulence factor BrkB family protein [Ornithinimicrobium sp. W1679]|uniref:YihY/virulence factor BrkB family protein n=1 Tax=unclassified Ornithinimicrobium TaxID=2615080 RepID=UPI003CFA95C6